MAVFVGGGVLGRNLRWAWCVSLVLAVLALAVGCSGANGAGGGKEQASPVATGPRIAIPEDSFDFGKVPLNKVVSHSFTIKNVGTAPLTLLGEPPVRAVQGC